MKYPKVKIVRIKDTEDILIDSSELIDMTDYKLAIRSAGSLAGKAIYLQEFINGQEIDEWIIAKDEYNDLCLIPLTKQLKNVYRAGKDRGGGR